MSSFMQTTFQSHQKVRTLFKGKFQVPNLTWPSQIKCVSIFLSIYICKYSFVPKKDYTAGKISLAGKQYWYYVVVEPQDWGLNIQIIPKKVPMLRLFFSWAIFSSRVLYLTPNSKYCKVSIREKMRKNTIGKYAHVYKKSFPNVRLYKRAVFYFVGDLPD